MVVNDASMPHTKKKAIMASTAIMTAAIVTRTLKENASSSP